MPTLLQEITEIVTAQNFGKPTAVKRGRHPQWPYVPVIDHGTHTEQLKGFAYPTRAEALGMARRTIEARRHSLLVRLQEPRHRALRKQHGLPTEI